MKEHNGEVWRFAVSQRRADRVFLVQQSEGCVSTWREMTLSPRGMWELTHTLSPGRHRFHYFTNEGGAYFNCGTEGLLAERLSSPHPAVSVDPVEMSMSA